MNKFNLIKNKKIRMIEFIEWHLLKDVKGEGGSDIC